MNILVLGLGCNENDEIDDRFDLENFEQLIVGTWKAEKDVIDCFPDSPENTNIEILDECESQSILTIESAGVASDLILISTRYFNFQGTCQMTEDSPRNLELSLDGEVLLIRFPPDAGFSTIFALTENTLQIGRFDGLCNGGGQPAHVYREYTRVN